MENSQITFLQQENFQLKVKLLLQDKPKVHVDADKGKGKEILDDDKLEDSEVGTKRRIPRTMGLKKVLQREENQQLLNQVGRPLMRSLLMKSTKIESIGLIGSMGTLRSF